MLNLSKLFHVNPKVLSPIDQFKEDKSQLKNLTAKILSTDTPKAKDVEEAVRLVGKLHKNKKTDEVMHLQIERLFRKCPDELLNVLGSKTAMEMKNRLIEERVNKLNSVGAGKCSIDDLVTASQSKIFGMLAARELFERLHQPKFCEAAAIAIHDLYTGTGKLEGGPLLSQTGSKNLLEAALELAVFNCGSEMIGKIFYSKEQVLCKFLSQALPDGFKVHSIVSGEIRGIEKSKLKYLDIIHRVEGGIEGGERNTDDRMPNVVNYAPEIAEYPDEGIEDPYLVLDDHSQQISSDEKEWQMEGK